MANYLRAELYKIFRRKYTYGFFLFLLGGAALLVSLWVYTNTLDNHVDFATSAGFLMNLLGLGFYVVLVTGDIAFSDQYKFNTLKNEVSYGIPRARLYLGKLAMAYATALFACAAVIGFYLALSGILFPHNPAMDAVVLGELGKMLMSILPLWLGAQALSFFFLAFFKSSMAASFAFVGVLVALPQVVKLLAFFVDIRFASLNRFLLTEAYKSMPLGGNWAVGGVWLVVSTALGLLSLRRREIS